MLLTKCSIFDKHVKKIYFFLRKTEKINTIYSIFSTRSLPLYREFSTVLQQKKLNQNYIYYLNFCFFFELFKLLWLFNLFS